MKQNNKRNIFQSHQKTLRFHMLIKLTKVNIRAVLKTNKVNNLNKVMVLLILLLSCRSLLMTNGLKGSKISNHKEQPHLYHQTKHTNRKTAKKASKVNQQTSLKKS